MEWRVGQQLCERDWQNLQCVAAIETKFKAPRRIFPFLVFLSSFAVSKTSHKTNLEKEFFTIVVLLDRIFVREFCCSINTF